MIHISLRLVRVFLLLIYLSVLFSCNRQRDINLKALLEDAQDMDETAKERFWDNHKLLMNIQKNVEERGNKANEVISFDDGKKLVKHCDSIIGSINKIYKLLISNAVVKHVNNDDEEEDKNEEYNLEILADVAYKKISIDNSKLDSLYQLINEYNNFTRSSDTAYNILKEQLNSKSFLSLQLLTLAMLKVEVIEKEEERLQDLLDKVGNSDFKYDQLSMEVIPESYIVEEGNNYTAKIFYIAQGDGSYIKSITCNGKALLLDSNGEGKLSFLAKANKFDKDGLCKKKLKGSIRYESFIDSTFTFEHEYLIRKGCK